MDIANPIYDVVFKYLMEDNKIAKLMLSSIIEEKIISLNFLPEKKSFKFENKPLTVKVMDFSAKIETPKGEEKQVIIELQKAKFPTDIIRFRRYLGGQYISKANTKIIEKGKDDESSIVIENPLPIITIYLLGHKLKHTKAPLIDVKRIYYDRLGKKEIKEREEFIESLTHDSYIIQIPYLKQKYKTDIENLLSIFDQDNVKNDKHILNVNPNNYPEKFKKIIRRLQQAMAEEEVRDTMDFEDEYVEELETLERRIQIKDEKLEKKDKEIENNKAEIENNKVEIKNNKAEIESKNAEIENKNAELEKNMQLIEKLKRELEQNLK